MGYNLRWLMRAVVHLGLKGLLSCLLWLAYWARLSATKRTQAEVGVYGRPQHPGLPLMQLEKFLKSEFCRAD